MGPLGFEPRPDVLALLCAPGLVKTLNTAADFRLKG